MNLKNWPCAINEAVLTNAASINDRGKSGDLVGFPQRGLGDRCLFCDQYDRCLTLACQKNWRGFDCRCCSYEKKGRINFVLEEFAADIDTTDFEEEILFGNECQLEQLVRPDNDQEDFLLTLIDQGAFHDDSEQER